MWRTVPALGGTVRNARTRRYGTVPGTLGPSIMNVALRRIYLFSNLVCDKYGMTHMVVWNSTWRYLSFKVVS